MYAFSGKRPLHRAILGIIGEFGMEKTAAGCPYKGFPGKEAGANVISVLDVAAAVIDGNSIPDGVEYRLKFAGLGAQPQVGGFQLPDLLLDFGVKTDFGAFET